MRFKRRHYEEEIDAFDQWIKRMIEGNRSVYFLNFMFRQLPKCERAWKELMEAEIRRVYATLVTREVRRPRSTNSRRVMPRFFGCPDLPVPKRDKRNRRLVIANEGVHYNGLLILSPFGRGLLDPERDLNNEPYLRSDSWLERIHVTPVEHGSMVQYTLKAINRSGEWDDLLVLPRVISELHEKNFGAAFR